MVRVKVTPPALCDRIPTPQDVPSIDLGPLLSEIERQANPGRKSKGNVPPLPKEHADVLRNMAKTPAFSDAAKAVFGEVSEHSFSAELWEQDVALGRKILQAAFSVQLKINANERLSRDEERLLRTLTSNPHVMDLMIFAADEMMARKKTHEFFEALDELRKVGSKDRVYQQYLERFGELAKAGRFDELERMQQGFSPEVKKALARVNGIFETATSIDEDLNVGLEEQFAAARAASAAGSDMPKIDDVVRAAMSDRVRVQSGFVQAWWGGEPPKDAASAPTPQEAMAKIASSCKERFDRLNDSLERIGLQPFSLEKIAHAIGEVGIRAYDRRDSANNVLQGEDGELTWKPPKEYSLKHEGDEANGGKPVLVSPVAFSLLFFGLDPQGRSPHEIKRLRKEEQELSDAKKTEGRILSDAVRITAEAEAKGVKLDIQEVIRILRERDRNKPKSAGKAA